MFHLISRLAAPLAAALLVLTAGAALSDRPRTELTHGGDTFVAGGVLDETLSARGDAFISARTTTARGSSGGDLHATGFDLTIAADAARDVYAIGGTVVLRGKVGEDLTAGGFSVRTEPGAETAGNARLMGNTVNIEGPVTGALSALGQDVILNAPIGGDARITARTLTFGPDAVVSGTLTYSSRERIEVPARVAAADRVVFEQITPDKAWRDWEEMRGDMPVLPTFASMFLGFLLTLAFFLVLGALMLTFMPRRLSQMRKSLAAAPGQTLILGVIGLSMLLGMVPIIALTIVGLPFVPIVVLSIVVTWTLGYGLGAYSVAMWVWLGFGGEPDPSKLVRLVVLAVAITVVALLNFIPFVGWVANYTLVLLGIGAMTRAVFLRMMGNPGLAFDVDMKPIDD